MTAPGLAPGLMPGGRFISQVFAGSLLFTSLTGNYLPYPEYQTIGGCSAAVALPQDTDPWSFWLKISGNPGALVVDYLDTRHIQGTGTGRLSLGTLSATIVVNGHTVTIAGTVSSAAFVGTVTVVHGSSTEVHAANAAGPANPPSLVAGTYYADATNGGSDAHPGTFASPKLSLPVPAQDGVYYLVHGSRWNSQLSNGSVAYVARGVGSGTWASLNATETLSTGGWTADGSGGWYRAVTRTVIDSLSNDLIPIENGRQLAPRGTLAACQTDVGSSYTDVVGFGSTATTITLTIHPLGGGNPNTNGAVYELPLLGTALYGAGGSQFSRIHARGTIGHNGPLSISSNQSSAAIDNSTLCEWLLITHGNYHCGVICGGTYKNVLGYALCSIRQGTNIVTSSMFAWYCSGAGDGRNFTWYGGGGLYDCTTKRLAYGQGFGDGLFTCHATSGTLGNMDLHEPLQMYDSGAMIFEASPMGIKTIDLPFVARHSGAGGTLIQCNDCTVTRMRYYCHESAVSGSVMTDFRLADGLVNAGAGVSITDSLLCTGFNGYDYSFWQPAGRTAGANNVFARNTCYNPNTAVGAFRCAIQIKSTGTPFSLQFDANMFCGAGWTHVVQCADTANWTGVAGDNEVWQVNAIKWYGTTQNLAYWQGIYSYVGGLHSQVWPNTDLHSVVGTPTFDAESDATRPLLKESAGSPTIAKAAGCRIYNWDTLLSYPWNHRFERALAAVGRSAA